jgi:hypothetical protein
LNLLIELDYKITFHLRKHENSYARDFLGAETINTWASFLSKNQNILTLRVRFDMTPITQLYWIRVVLGVISGEITAVIVFLLHSPNDITSLVNGFTVALILYLVTYYILKAQFKSKIEKQGKILSTAIAMYFFAWLSFFVLFYTVILAIT